MQVADRLVARLRRVPPWLVDVGVAGIVAAVTVVSVIVEDRRESHDLDALGVALLAVQVVPLVWRRRAPVAVMLACVAGTVLYGIAELPDSTIQFPMVVAFYTVATLRPRPVWVPYAGAVAVAGVVGMLVAGDADVADVTVGYVSTVTALVVGDATRIQRERSTWLEERRAHAARQAAADERVRLARDLHDVVAHHVSVIAVQAEAAQEILAARPDRAERAMADVAETARSALTELRRLLGVLRAEDVRAPQPGLADVDELLESVRRAGLAVDLRTEGVPRPLDGLLGVTVYRLVQEALTNVLKHADARRAEVELRYGDDELVVTVVDDGRAPPGSAWSQGSAGSPGSSGLQGGGHGLLGMRERATALGGRLDAGPHPDGGFSVQARLLLDRPPPVRTSLSGSTER